MPDWTKSMQQTFEYYMVDPRTWRNTMQIKNVKSCTISRDSEADTLGSATFNVTSSLDECYVRVYLVTIQNGIEERFPLGTYLVQTPGYSFNGKVHDYSIDAYTPLLELKENMPPLGYSLFKDDNIMQSAYMLAREWARAPVVKTDCVTPLPQDFVAESNDTWLTFIRDLIHNAKYELSLDEMGRILFAPKQDTASLQYVWTYDDNNSSILYPELTMDHDLYNIPNVVEVVYSNGDEYYETRVVNDDPNSPISTVNRGRTIMYRDTDPALVGESTRDQIDEYAIQLLKDLSSIEYKLSYSHGYCPVRVGDCVRFNYTRAGIKNVKARVISQSLKCTSGCEVTEKAVFTAKLWR